MIDCVKFRRSNLLILVLKLSVFLSLSIVFYVYYFSEVVEKYAQKNSYFSLVQETLTNGSNPPVFTICLAGPIAKLAVLKKYNMSLKALAEPNLREKGTLISLNKTVLDLYRESTYELNRDFELNMTYSEYDIDGNKDYRTKLLIGQNVNHTTKVHIKHFSKTLKALILRDLIE